MQLNKPPSPPGVKQSKPTYFVVSTNLGFAEILGSKCKLLKAPVLFDCYSCGIKIGEIS